MSTETTRTDEPNRAILTKREMKAYKRAMDEVASGRGPLFPAPYQALIYLCGIGSCALASLAR